uniref:Uncharacterized protein n=1 Tax=Amblyomma triste TaxID=251400 RepID=A0A023G176_AMBTT
MQHLYSFTDCALLTVCATSVAACSTWLVMNVPWLAFHCNGTILKMDDIQGGQLCICHVLATWMNVQFVRRMVNALKIYWAHWWRF